MKLSPDADFTESERDVVRFAVINYLFEAFDRMNAIFLHKPITEIELIELEVCLDNGKDAISIISRFFPEEDFNFYIPYFTRKLDKAKKKFSDRAIAK